MTRSFILIILGLTISTSLFAQNSIDILTVSGRYGFPRPYKSTYAGNASEHGMLVNLKVPVVFNEKYIWYNELSYTELGVSNDITMSPTIANPIDLHGFILQTGLVVNLKDGKAMQILFTPRLMTDMGEITSKNWQFGGLFMFEKRYNDKLMLRYGMLYNPETFGPNFTPVVSVNWQFADRWSLTGMLPVFGKVSYTVSENTTVGLAEFALTTSYPLSDPIYNGAYIERNSIDFALFGRQRLFGNVFIEGRFGHTIGRNYGQFAADQKVDFRVLIFDFGPDRTPENVEFKDGFIANVRLVYNLPLD